MFSVPPASLRPAFLATYTPPGKPSRASVGGVVMAALAVALLASAALSGLGDETPSGFVNGSVGLKLLAHRGCLALSAVASCSAVILGVVGWDRSRGLSFLALLGACAWLALFVWARFMA